MQPLELQTSETHLVKHQKTIKTREYFVTTIVVQPMMAFERDYYRESLQRCQICKREGHERDIYVEHYHLPWTCELCGQVTLL